MAQSPVKMPAPPQGVVASLAGGFETVNARLELILLPLALDLFLWFGPRVSIRPLLEGLLAQFALVAESAPDAASRVQLQQQLQALRDVLAPAVAEFNLLSALSTAPLGLPSLARGRMPMVTPLGTPAVWPIDNLLAGLLVLAACVLGGLLLGALYFGGIAQQVRDRKLRLGLLVRQAGGNWARLTALGAVGLLVVVALGVPLAAISALLGALSVLVGALVWIVGTTVILWVLFYGGFALHGMLLQRRGLFGALWDSLRLVQVNLPHAAGLFLLIVVINSGLVLVWNLAGADSWLWLLGLGGHALISTSLVAATFVFYQDRYRWWVEMRQALRTQPQAKQPGMRPRA